MSTLLDIITAAVENDVSEFDVIDSTGKAWSVKVGEPQKATTLFELAIAQPKGGES